VMWTEVHPTIDYYCFSWFSGVPQEKRVWWVLAVARLCWGTDSATTEPSLRRDLWYNPVESLKQPTSVSQVITTNEWLVKAKPSQQSVTSESINDSHSRGSITYPSPVRAEHAWIDHCRSCNDDRAKASEILLALSAPFTSCLFANTSKLAFLSDYPT
jgi:hypothetical protein